MRQKTLSFLQIHPRIRKKYFVENLGSTYNKDLNTTTKSEWKWIWHSLISLLNRSSNSGLITKIVLHIQATPGENRIFAWPPFTIDQKRLQVVIDANFIAGPWYQLFTTNVFNWEIFVLYAFHLSYFICGLCKEMRQSTGTCMIRRRWISQIPLGNQLIDDAIKCLSRSRTFYTCTVRFGSTKNLRLHCNFSQVKSLDLI